MKSISFKRHRFPADLIRHAVWLYFRWGAVRQTLKVSGKVGVSRCRGWVIVNSISFKRHRFPTDVIRHAVWLYFRFSLSFRDVEELMAQRGIDVRCCQSNANLSPLRAA